MATLSRRAIDRFVAAQATVDKVLDLGCGNSPYAAWFPQRLGCDLVPGAGVHVVADTLALPFLTESFDVVLSTEMLEHVRVPELAVTEMGRVLRPGGRLVLTTRFLYPIHSNPHDYFRFTRFGLLHLLKGWHVELLEEDVGAINTAAQPAEFAVAAWPRWLRWPAKAAIRTLGLADLVPQGKRTDGATGAIASAYLVIGKKPLCARP